MTTPLLQIVNATKIYGGGFMKSSKKVVALQDFNLTIPQSPAGITTIAGESGSGKSTLANLVLGFVRLTSGKIYFQGNDVEKMNRKQRSIYRRQVQAVFQDPYAVYNPFYPVRHIFDVVIHNFHLAENKTMARDIIEDALNIVGMQGKEILHKYPHQLSGGQRQRMMVARAFLLKPALIVADEPVSMVDASLRAMILDIMLRLRDEHGISFLYITHDISTAYQIGGDIYMLYQGTTMEKGKTVDVIENASHPYVKQLIDSVPIPDPDKKWDSEISLPDDETMREQVDSGCRFYSRCSKRWEKCLGAKPPLYPLKEEAHACACYLYEKETVAEE